MAGRVRRFLGDSPGRVLLRLVVLSFVVGLILAALDLHPLDLLRLAERLARRVYDMGFEAVERGLEYLLLGALIVVPLYLLARILKLVGRRRRD